MNTVLSMPEVLGLFGGVAAVIGALLKWAVAKINRKIAALEDQTKKATSAAHSAYQEITNDHSENIRVDIDSQFGELHNVTTRLEHKLDQVSQVVKSSSREIDTLQSDIKRVDHSLGEFNSLLVQEQRDRADIRADARATHDRIWQKIEHLEQKGERK